MSECERYSSSLNCERINQARNMNTVTDITKLMHILNWAHHGMPSQSDELEHILSTLQQQASLLKLETCDTGDTCEVLCNYFFRLSR